VDRGRHLSAQARTSRAATGYREWINDYDNSAAAYYALITGIDAAVGMIREALTREGLAANTVILFLRQRLQHGRARLRRQGAPLRGGLEIAAHHL
jgi:arylsulfatase A-like enzyme